MNFRSVLNLVVFFIGVEGVSGSALAHGAKADGGKAGSCSEWTAGLKAVTPDGVLAGLRRHFVDVRNGGAIKTQLEAISPQWHEGGAQDQWSAYTALSDGTVHVELGSQGFVDIRFYSERHFDIPGMRVSRVGSDHGVKTAYSSVTISGPVVSQNLARAAGILKQLRDSAPKPEAQAQPAAASIQP